MGSKRWYRTDDFLKLQGKWYKKLEQKGFKDLEPFDKIYGNSGTTFLKTTTIKFIHSYKEETFNHFRLARNYLQHGTFASSFEENVWRMYSEGYSLREIATELKHTKHACSIFPLSHLIRKLKTAMYKFNDASEEGIKEVVND